MTDFQLPEGNGTNGTYLHTQAVHSIVRSMITRQDTWHPRYGTKPGYGDDAWHGLPDVFTSTVGAALEMGAMVYARGVIDNHFSFYVRNDGMIMHRGVQVPSSCRMLTLLALYHGYSGGDDTLLLQHFDKAKALADWLLYRRSRSLNFSTTDPRYGIPQGDAEAENYPEIMLHGKKPLHFLSSAAEMYRAFTEIGRVWEQIGKVHGRKDILSHAQELLKTAPLLYHDLHASLNRTVYHTGNSQAPRCWPFVAEVNDTDGQSAHPYRAYPELMYSGALMAQQVRDIYDYIDHVNGSLTLGVPGWGRHISTRAPFGFAYGLLQHDMVEHYLLHYFAVSAHAYDRGTWTTPESANIVDRGEPALPYAVTGVHTAPMYLKWMLAFEEPETRTLWLAKATPRDWLETGQQPIAAYNLTTRYGRVSLHLQATATPYTVHASVHLPPSFATPGSQPLGGVRLRVRVPLAQAGRMSSVTVGGKAWSEFDAAEETVNFPTAHLTPSLLANGLTNIVIQFSARDPVSLRRASVDMSQRTLPQPTKTTKKSFNGPTQRGFSNTSAATVHASPPPGCPAGMTRVETFDLNGTGEDRAYTRQRGV